MGRERLSNIDTLMLRVEDSVQPNVGTGVLILGAPVDVDWLKATIEARLLAFGRFRQRIVRPRLPWGHLHWEDDPDFDLDYHLQQVTLPPPGDQVALQELVSLLASVPLDLNRPLWQMHLVKVYGPGCALVCRVHHSLADGVALMHVLLALADADPGASLPLMEPGHPQPPNGANRQLPARLGEKGLELLASLPRAGEVAQQSQDAAAALRDLLLSGPDSDTVLRGQRGEPKRAAWSVPFPLDDIKTIGRQLGGTVNDVVLTVLTGALRRYLADRGDPVSDVNIHAMIPISLRPDGNEEELGNQIGVVFLTLPMESADPVDRLREIARRMDEHKDSREAPILFSAMKTFGRAPSRLIKPAVNYLCSHATIVVTNVKGPQQPLYVAGSLLEALMAWIPRYGGIGVGVSILSYAGEVRVGAISDRDILADPEALVAGFQVEFDALLALAYEKSPSVAELPAKKNDAQAAQDESLTA